MEELLKQAQDLLLWKEFLPRRAAARLTRQFFFSSIPPGFFRRNKPYLTRESGFTGLRGSYCGFSDLLEKGK